MNTKKILVPLDGSYKEFNKYKEAFSKTDIWGQFIFLIDDDINRNVFKHSNYIQLDTTGVEPDISRCEKILKSCGFDGSFDSFCIVEFYQNRTKFRSSEMHRNECAKKLICLYDLMQTIEYDYVIYNLVSHFFPRAIQLISKKIGKPVYGYTQSLIPGKEYIWLDDEFHYISELKELMSNLKIHESSIETIMKEVVFRKKNKTYMSVFGRSFWQEVKSLYAVRSRFKPSAITKSRLMFFLEKFIFRKMKAYAWKKNAADEIPDEKFIFFPLHMPGEAQTLIRGYPFINDVEVLYQLSLIVPSNIKIVVKEHPGYEGWKSLYELDLIKIMPNVTMVKSSISSHDLIKKSEFVVTINSSVWFESLAFNKNVITLGKGIFTGLEITYEANGFLELKKIISEILARPKEMIASKEKVERFVAAYSQMSFEGEIYRYTANENNNFAQLIRKKIQTIQA